MARKTFKSAPKPGPSPEAIERFVNDGHGHDVTTTEIREPAKTETQKSRAVAGGVTARLTVDLPTDLHRRFKATCSLSGLKMNDEIRRFIERRIAELENR